jgi:hypothetical protein
LATSFRSHLLGFFRRQGSASIISQPSRWLVPPLERTSSLPAPELLSAHSTRSLSPFSLCSLYSLCAAISALGSSLLSLSAPSTLERQSEAKVDPKEEAGGAHVLLQLKTNTLLVRKKRHFLQIWWEIGLSISETIPKSPSRLEG